MRSSAAALLAVLFAAVVVGCGSSSDEVAPPPATESESPASAPASDKELAPPLAGVTLDGTAVALADVRGRPVLINVWSSW